MYQTNFQLYGFFQTKLFFQIFALIRATVSIAKQKSNYFLFYTTSDHERENWKKKKIAPFSSPFIQLDERVSSSTKKKNHTYR